MSVAKPTMKKPIPPAGRKLSQREAVQQANKKFSNAFRKLAK